MTEIDWSKVRDSAGAIDLVLAMDEYIDGDQERRMSWANRLTSREVAASYLRQVESLQPIASRQAAAHAIVTALWLADARAAGAGDSNG